MEVYMIRLYAHNVNQREKPMSPVTSAPIVLSWWQA